MFMNKIWVCIFIVDVEYLSTNYSFAEAAILDPGHTDQISVSEIYSWAISVIV